MTKISIIVPIYNVEKYLKKAIDSLSKQTLNDIEIICIDDASTDNSLKILKDLSLNDNRIKIIEQKENQGQGIARNIGMNEAKGDYIMFLDPDDWYELNACELLYNIAIENNANVVEATCKKVNEITNEIEIFDNYKFVSQNFNLNIKPNTFVEARKLKNYNIRYYELSSWGKIFKTSFLKEKNIKFSPYRRAEDQPFMFDVKLATPIYYIDMPIYNYLIRENSSRTYQILYEEITEEIKKVTSKYKNDKFAQNSFNRYVVWRFYSKYKNEYNSTNLIKFIFENCKYWSIRQFYLLMKDICL